MTEQQIRGLGNNEGVIGYHLSRFYTYFVEAFLVSVTHLNHSLSYFRASYWPPSEVDSWTIQILMQAIHTPFFLFFFYLYLLVFINTMSIFRRGSGDSVHYLLKNSLTNYLFISSSSSLQHWESCQSFIHWCHMLTVGSHAQCSQRRSTLTCSARLSANVGLIYLFFFNGFGFVLYCSIKHLCATYLFNWTS